MTSRISCIAFLVLPLIGLLSVAAQNPSEDSPSQKHPGSIKVKWFGHSSFLLTTSRGTKIITDPIDFKGYHVPPGTTADIVTVSHEHVDHNCVTAVTGSPAVFHGTDKACSTVNAVDTTVQDVRLYTVPSFHDPGHHGRNAIFVLEFDGIRAAHLGDIGEVLTEDQIAAMGKIDILLIPVGGRFTIGPVRADSIVSQLSIPRIVIPMHYQTEAFDVLPFTEDVFLEGKDNVRRLDGNEFVIDLSQKKSEPEYVVFQYETTRAEP